MSYPGDQVTAPPDQWRRRTSGEQGFVPGPGPSDEPEDAGYVPATRRGRPARHANPTADQDQYPAHPSGPFPVHPGGSFPAHQGDFPVHQGDSFPAARDEGFSAHPSGPLPFTAGPDFSAQPDFSAHPSGPFPAAPAGDSDGGRGRGRGKSRSDDRPERSRRGRRKPAGADRERPELGDWRETGDSDGPDFSGMFMSAPAWEDTGDSPGPGGTAVAFADPPDDVADLSDESLAAWTAGFADLRINAHVDKSRPSVTKPPRTSPPSTTRPPRATPPSISKPPRSRGAKAAPLKPKRAGRTRPDAEPRDDAAPREDIHAEPQVPDFAPTRAWSDPEPETYSYAPPPERRAEPDDERHAPPAQRRRSRPGHEDDAPATKRRRAGTDPEDDAPPARGHTEPDVRRDSRIGRRRRSQPEDHGYAPPAERRHVEPEAHGYAPPAERRPVEPEDHGYAPPAPRSAPRTGDHGYVHPAERHRFGSGEPDYAPPAERDGPEPEDRSDTGARRARPGRRRRPEPEPEDHGYAPPAPRQAPEPEDHGYAPPAPRQAPEPETRSFTPPAGRGPAGLGDQDHDLSPRQSHGFAPPAPRQAPEPLTQSPRRHGPEDRSFALPSRSAPAAPEEVSFTEFTQALPVTDGLPVDTHAPAEVPEFEVPAFEVPAFEVPAHEVPAHEVPEPGSLAEARFISLDEPSLDQPSLDQAETAVAPVRRSPAASRTRAAATAARKASRRKGNRWVVAGSALSIVAVLGALVYVLYPSGTAQQTPLSHQPAAFSPQAAGGPAPSAAPSGWQHIATRAEDSTPLTLPQLFPAQFTTAGATYVKTIDQGTSDCAKALFGVGIQAVVRTYSCSQVMRATYLSSGQNVMGTIGVLNLGTAVGATKVGKASGTNGFIAQLPGHSGPTHSLDKGTGLEEALVKGHYLILTWVEFANLHAPKTTAEKAQLRTFSTNLIDQTANINLTNRMVMGEP